MHRTKWVDKIDHVANRQLQPPEVVVKTHYHRESIGVYVLMLMFHVKMTFGARSAQLASETCCTLLPHGGVVRGQLSMSTPSRNRCTRQLIRPVSGFPRSRTPSVQKRGFAGPYYARARVAVRPFLGARTRAGVAADANGRNLTLPGTTANFISFGLYCLQAI